MGNVLNACNNVVNKQDKDVCIEVFRAYRVSNCFFVSRRKIYKTALSLYIVLNTINVIVGHYCKVTRTLINV